MFLGDAVLSSDHKHLLYSEFSLGDPVYYVMDLGSKKTFSITGDDIAGAMSARWADDDTVIGPAYSGGAFTANTSGKITAVEGLSGEGLIVVRQIKDKIYYTSNSGETLQTFDLNTKEKATLKIERVGSVIPSPGGDQLLVLQYKDSAQALLLTDTDGGIRRLSWKARSLAVSPGRRTSGGLPTACPLTGTVRPLLLFMSTIWNRVSLSRLQTVQGT